MGNPEGFPRGCCKREAFSAGPSDSTAGAALIDFVCFDIKPECLSGLRSGYSVSVTPGVRIQDGTETASLGICVRSSSCKGRLKTHCRASLGGPKICAKVAPRITRRLDRRSIAVCCGSSFRLSDVFHMFASCYAFSRSSLLVSKSSRESNGSPRATCHSPFTSLRTTAITALFFIFPPSRATFLPYHARTTGSS